jgi:putative phosphoribosyl transferase
MKRFSRQVEIVTSDATLVGDLTIPEPLAPVIIFAHGSGSSRLSPRNRAVASFLQGCGFGTLLFDLLTPGEEREDQETRAYRFDIPLLSRRLVDATTWLIGQRFTRASTAYFGASTGAAAALVAAAALPDSIAAVVSRGGRPDLAGDALRRVRAPTQLIVGGRDSEVLALNRRALAQLDCEKELVVVPSATHLFEEPGALDAVAHHAAGWFAHYLIPSAHAPNAARRANDDNQ